MVNGWLVEQTEHIRHLWIKFAISCGCGFMEPQNNHKRIPITDQHNKYNNDEKVCNSVRITKYDIET